MKIEMVKETRRRRRWPGIVGRILLAVVLVAALVLLGFRHAAYVTYKNLTVETYQLDATSPWDGGAAYMAVPYASDSESQYVDIYVPRTEGETPPLYVVIHGGGFISNDARARQALLMLRYFRDHGYACASINYRLAQEAAFPAAVCDCKAAIRFLRLHADEYGYNADRFAVFGESAGGYLATMCAVTADDEFADVRCIGQADDVAVSTKPDMLVDYYGHIDRRGMEDDWKHLGIPKLVLNIANSWTQGDVLQGFENVESFWCRKNLSEMTPEELAVTDPYTYIQKNDLTGLSAWIVHGDCDITVPWLHSERFCAAMRAKLDPEDVSYHLVPGMGHASDPLFSDELLGELKAWMDARILG